MKTTNNDIINISLGLFAERGYNGTSTSMIAKQLGITKGALYKHFKNKKSIFDAIWNRMKELDAERAKKDNVPEKQYKDNPQSYLDTDISEICTFVNNQFLFWTENKFAKNFRRMITLEQYKSPEMKRLYQDVIAEGPVKYTENLMNEMIKAGRLNNDATKIGGFNLAIMLFAPLSLMFQLSDAGIDHLILKKHLYEITKDFEKRWKKK